MVLCCQPLNATDMIAMFMRNEYSLYHIHFKPQPLHPFLCFPAGEPCIYKHSLLLITYIVTIAITPRI